MGSAREHDCNMGLGKRCSLQILGVLRDHLAEPLAGGPLALEAQQRYFSYRAILAAIVSQNSFVLVLMRYRTIIARYVAKWGIAQLCLCKTKYPGGGIAPFGGAANIP